MCHHNSFLIYESLVDANAKRWNFVTHISVLFSMACSLVLGVTGYSTFTGNTQGMCNAATRNLFRDGGMFSSVFRPFSFSPFPSFLLLFPLLLPPRISGPSNPAIWYHEKFDIKYNNHASLLWQLVKYFSNAT